MKNLRITIILPFPACRPGGGVKIMYEYANRLQQRGHKIIILHSIRRPFKKMKSPLWLKQFTYWLRGAERPSWFPLHANIESRIVPQITNEYLPDADIVFSTWWEMAYMIYKLDATKGKPFNLIQGYEVWKGHAEAVNQSYSLPIHHLVIAKYLQKLVLEHSGRVPLHIPIAIDTNVFKLIQPINQRLPYSVMMLYSKESVKGSDFGLKALMMLKKIVPKLTATFFGVFDKPNLPDWISYHKKPNNLVDLYNQNAIFLSPSLSEGWALPPAEAMSCGCAVVCTNIGGHADYAVDNKTALMVAVKNPNDIVEKLNMLLQNESLRIELASAGNSFIQENFSWDNSIRLVETAFYSACPDE